MHPYQQKVENLEVHLKTSLSVGLHSATAQRLLDDHGPNALPTHESRFKGFELIWDQIKSPLIIILIIAGTVSSILHEWPDAIIIFLTVFLNVIIGFIQEFKANESLKKLQSMVKMNAVVMRDGIKKSIPSEEIVPGDILFLSSGDKVSADGRIVYAKLFQVDEAALTGESEPIEKSSDIIKDEVGIGDRYNMVFRGTTVTTGEAKVLVTGTGVNSELGKIATLVDTTQDDETPLQKQLTRLSKVIGVVVVAVAFFIFGMGLLLPGTDYSLFLLFETAIAIAVAAIPEGLAISLTVILAIGMQRILKRKALVRRLVAAETLGSVSVICTDKTGTLTQAKMRVAFYVNAQGNQVDQDAALFHAGILGSNASLENPKASEEHWHFVGDTTEAALIHSAYSHNVDVSGIRRDHERLDEIPFSSKQKYMATLVKGEKGFVSYLKGAPEKIIPLCTQNSQSKELLHKAQEFAQKGYRTLALAKKIEEGSSLSKKLDGYECLGLAIIEDPLRDDVKKTLHTARKAGIRVIMITGDHMKTAAHIAAELGIPHKEKHICDGPTLDSMSEQELKESIDQLHVFARVEPKHKIRIVQALQENGEVVAMTGDGVNDAPALKGADIGVAVGSGTDVAKETADMVLLNDSFSTIVDAVSEGRRIYQNLKKVVLYLLCGSFTEVLIIIGSILSGFPLAMLPAQILWINIVQETFPTMALAFDGADKENMSDLPRKKSSSIFDSEMKAMVISVTLISAALLFGLFAYLKIIGSDIAYARTMVFSGLGVAIFFYIFSIRSMRHFVWEIPHFNNKQLNGALLLSLVLLMLAVYAPGLSDLLRLVPLSLQDWGILCIIGIVNVIVIEIIKMLYIRRQRIT